MRKLINDGFEVLARISHIFVQMIMMLDRALHETKPEDHWSCIAHLIAEDMLKSAIIEEKMFKHSPWAWADNPLGPKF